MFTIKLFIAFTSVLLVLLPLECQANSENVYARILELQPKIEKSYAKKVSSSIAKCGEETGFDELLLVAIYNQESKLDNRAKNCIKGVLDEESAKGVVTILSNGGKSLKQGLVVSDVSSEISKKPLTICMHLGIGQINVSTAIKYCPELTKLTTDVGYNIQCSCDILQGFKKIYGNKESDWWTRYNSPSRYHRDIYKKLIMRYYPSSGSKQ